MRFASAAMLTFVTKVGTFGIAAATAILLARTLGPAARGEYALLIVLPTVVSGAVNAGFATAIVVTVGRRIEDAGRSLTHALIVALAASLVGWLGAGLTYPLWRDLLPQTSSGTVALALSAVAPLLLYSFLISLVQGRREFAVTSGLILFSYLVQLALQAILVVWAGLGLDGALWGFVLAHVVLVVVALGVVSRAVRPSAPDTVLLREQLAFGSVTYVGSLAWLALTRTGLVVAGVVAPVDDVGRLAVALTLVEVLLYAADSVAFALAPHAAAGPFAQLRRALAAVVTASALGAAALFVLSGTIVSVLFGHEYADAASVVRWLLPGMVVAGIARVRSTELNARRHERESAIALVVAAVVTAPLALILTRSAGVDGAAAATSAGFALAALSLSVAARLSAADEGRDRPAEDDEVSGERASPYVLEIDRELARKNDAGI